jgi:hypothetical protein
LPSRERSRATISMKREASKGMEKWVDGASRLWRPCHADEWTQEILWVSGTHEHHRRGRSACRAIGLVESRAATIQSMAVVAVSADRSASHCGLSSPARGRVWPTHQRHRRH